MVLLTLLAATATVPPPAGGGSVLTDYPEAALRTGEQGTTVVDLLVSPSGRVERCGILSSSGSATLDAATCAQFFKRARFRPARDSGGSTRYARLIQSVIWVISAKKTPPEPAPLPPLMEVTIAALPGDRTEPLDIDLMLDVDTSGALVSCGAQKPTGNSDFAPAACQQLRQDWRPLPLLDRAGKPVSYLYQTTVRFTVG